MSLRSKRFMTEGKELIKWQERLHHQVTSAGNPISMDLKTRYKIKGIGSEQTIESKVNIFVRKEDGKIEKVEDRWNDNIPEGPVAKVCWFRISHVMVHGEGLWKRMVYQKRSSFSMIRQRDDDLRKGRC